MKRTILIYSILVVIINSVFCNEIKNYEQILIKVIPIGKEEGHIGFYKKAHSGMPFGPRTFSVSNEGEIIIPDIINNRINIYDLDMNYQTTIIEKDEKVIDNSRYLHINSKKNIYGLTTGHGLKKIDKNGDTLFKIIYNKLPNGMKHNHSFFIFQENLFFYDDSGFIKSINENGKIQTVDQTNALLDGINNQWIVENSSYQQFIKTIPAEKKNILEQYKSDNKHIIVGDRYYSSRFKDNNDFFEKAKDFFNTVKEYI